jgi:hypothetical protein
MNSQDRRPEHQFVWMFEHVVLVALRWQLLAVAGAFLLTVDMLPAAALCGLLLLLLLLLLTVGYGELQCSKLLIEAGAKLDLVDNNQNTALHYAAGYGQVDTVKLLIDRWVAQRESDMLYKDI